MPLIRCCAIVAFAAAVMLQADEPRLTFTHYAGSDGGNGSEDGKGSAGRFYGPVGVATDRDGNVYVADINNDTIRKIDRDGNVTTVAGFAGLSGKENGVGAAGLFYGPAGTAVDASGNVYVADALNHQIRKITPSGEVSLLAGSPFGSEGGLNGVGSKASFRYPADVAVDASGNVYVADGGNHLIRKIAPDGTTTTLAGLIRQEGFRDGVGTAAQFRTPQGVSVDAAGNVYVADTRNDAIRKIAPDGTTTTIAGNNSPGREDGPGATARFYRPTGVTTSPSGNLYVADTTNGLIRKITPAGVVSTLAGGEEFNNAGSADGTGRAARFTSPYDIVSDADGNLYIADGGNHAIRKMTGESVVTTFAGKASVAAQVDGPLSEARFYEIRDMVRDASGNIFLIDGHVIRKITASGIVSTISGVETIGELPTYADGSRAVARFKDPVGIGLDPAGDIFVVDAGGHTVRKVTADGTVSTYAGTINQAGRDDGTLRQAKFRFPSDVAIDRDGTMYVSDDCTIRKISGGNVTTMLGRPIPPAIGCTENVDGPFATAKIEGPDNLVLDGKGNLYFTTVQTFGSSFVGTTANTIRKITPDGVVTTIAGDDAKRESYLDGFGTGARFFNIGSIAVDADGGIYVTEFFVHAIRYVTPEGLVTTIGGIPGWRGTADGTTLHAEFATPKAIVIDGAGNPIIAEAGRRLRIGRPALSDEATIDAIIGVVGGRRQLDTTARRASSWKWDLTRRPAASRSFLSSDAIRNPTFVADVEDVFEFRLRASDGVSESITRVGLLAVEGFPTSSGTNVVVQIGGIVLTFSQVRAAGQTVVAELPRSLVTPFADSKFVWAVYDISTTAGFTAPIQFCTTLPAAADARRISEFRLFVREGDAWVDRTSTRDAASRSICASLNSLGRIVLDGPTSRRRGATR